MIPQTKKILYATDLSQNSTYAFQYAVDMARRHGAKIVILHTIEPLPSYVEVYLTSGVVERIEQDREEAVQKIQNLLKEFCQKAEAGIGAPCLKLVNKILVRIGHSAEEILKVADEEKCDTIILGTHGKGFLAHTFLGSVSSAVLHRTRKPVFIIPLPAEKTTMGWESI